MGQSKAARPGGATEMASGVRIRAGAFTTILEHPHPALARPSYDVDPRDPEIVELSAMLIGRMRTTPGCVALSAPQLGRNVRLFCLGVNGLVVLANPEILALSGDVVMREGCTSVPGFSGDLARARDVVLAGVLPGTGRKVIVETEGLEARRILHHMDHLDGILFLDRVPDPHRAAVTCLQDAARKR